jgi:hypothetical protein
MNSRINVELNIISVEMAPDLISNALGIKCDHSWQIGDRRGRSLIIEKSNGWTLSSMRPDNDTLENHIKELLGRLSSHIKQFGLLKEHCEIELSCVIRSDVAPVLNFSQEVIRALSEIGAGLDIDLYLGKGGNHFCVFR